MIATECTSHAPNESTDQQRQGGESRKGRCRLRACSAASAETVAAFAVASGAKLRLRREAEKGRYKHRRQRPRQEAMSGISKKYLVGSNPNPFRAEAAC